MGCDLERLSPEKPSVAFVLSLIGGVTLLLGGGMISMMGSYGFGGMMNGYWVMAGRCVAMRTGMNRGTE